MGLGRSKPKGPSQAEIARRQEAARQAERERQQREQQEREAAQRAEQERAFAAREERRQQFAGQLLTAEQEASGQRRRFLRGV